MSATEMQETEVEQTEIPLETSEESVEVELKDNAIEVEEPKEEPKETASEQEQEQYGKAVQKRINKLTRRVKDTEREREEAVRYAQSMKEEADKVRARLQTLDQNYISEYGSRISAEQAQVESALKNAVETGDAQATVEAQRKLTQLAVAEDRYNQAKAQQEQQQKAASEALTQTPQQPDPKIFTSG